MKTIPILLDENQVAERLGFSVHKLRKMRYSATPDPLPYIKIMNTVRYSEQDVASWLERRRIYSSREAHRLK